MAYRIAEVRCFVLKLRRPEPYLGLLPGGSAPPEEGYAVRPPWRSLYSARFETLLVQLVADNGAVGWGEALAPVAPEVPAEIVRRLLAPVLRAAGDGSVPAPAAVRPLVSALRELMRERGHLGGHQADALAAVDIALWDLAGQVAGRPVHALLGGAYRDRVPTYLSGLPRPTDPERAELAAQWAERGVAHLKLHLGHGVAADLATLAAVRAAAPGVRFAVDAHWAYQVTEASRLAREAGDLLFLEAPLAPEDRAGHTDLARRVDVPVAVGETMRHRYELADWLAARAVGLAQPDVARTGITEAMVMADLAATHQVRVAPHHSVGLAVALAAGLQVSAAIENLWRFEYQPATTAAGQQILADPLPGGPAGFPVPDGPGLGIVVDPDAVADLAE